MKGWTSFHFFSSPRNTKVPPSEKTPPSQDHLVSLEIGTEIQREAAAAAAAAGTPAKNGASRKRMSPKVNEEVHDRCRVRREVNDASLNR